MAKIAESPELATCEFESKAGPVIFRPLKRGDIVPLASFLEGLSFQTRPFRTFEGYDRQAADELCHAINQYDKVRFVLETKGKIAGLVEVSLDIPKGDLKRYKQAGINLNPDKTCRFGPTLADEYQEQGLGTSAMKIVADIARHMGKERIILWGGVLQENESAIRFYEKCGFTNVGAFQRENGTQLYDMMLELQ